jgi:pimeloyl-ACP methyl ester carboxylesterase
MDVVLTGGARAHVRDAGAGPPVLFLHGNPDTGDLWDGVIRTLESRHRCLAPDLPGFGRSDVPPAFDCSLDGLAAWVNDLTGTLGVAQPLDLVVHDFGGLFGLAWAVRHPQRVRRLVIMNTVFFPDYRWHFWARVWRTPILGELSFALNSRWGMALEMRRGSRRLPVAHAIRAYDAMTPAMTRMVLRLYRAADPQAFTPWQDGLRALVATVPCLVLWGDRDPYIDKAFAERFGAREVRHFPNAGHWLPVEESGAVAMHLLAFLA